MTEHPSIPARKLDGNGAHVPLYPYM